MSFESLNCCCSIRKPSDRGEALHGQMEGVAVFVAGSAEAFGRRRTHVDGDKRTQKHMIDDVTVSQRTVLQTYKNTLLQHHITSETL